MVIDNTRWRNLTMAMKSPYNSWASRRPVGNDTKKKQRVAEVVNIQQWAKGTAELKSK